MKDSDRFKNSSTVYQEFLAERDEILKHKWIESQKVGHDIGFEKALVQWVRNHRDGWRAARPKAGEELTTFAIDSAE